MTLKSEFSHRLSCAEFIFLLLKLMSLKGVRKFQTNCFDLALFGLKKAAKETDISEFMKEMNFYYGNERYFCDAIDVAYTDLQSCSILAFINPGFLGFIYLGNTDWKDETEKESFFDKILSDLKKNEHYQFVNADMLQKLIKKFIELYGGEMDRLKSDSNSHLIEEFRIHWYRHISSKIY